MNRPRQRGFSRLDLLVTIIVVGMLIALLAYNHSGERGRIARCAGNLKALDRAMRDYIYDNANCLPIAGLSVEAAQNSWDQQLFSYLAPSAAKATGSDAKGELFLAAAPYFLCPSDKLPRGGHPRTYAMAERNTSDWPPSPEDETGVGIWWDRRSIIDLLGPDEYEKARTNLSSLPRLNLAIIPTPDRTILLTEVPLHDNKVGALSRTRALPGDQISALTADSEAYHFKRFNYLMADGHIDNMSALQAAGRWNIKPSNWQ